MKEFNNKKISKEVDKKPKLNRKIDSSDSESSDNEEVY
jgi:hypothetical protein